MPLSLPSLSVPISNIGSLITVVTLLIDVIVPFTVKSPFIMVLRLFIVVVVPFIIKLLLILTLELFKLISLPDHRYKSVPSPSIYSLVSSKSLVKYIPLSTFTLPHTTLALLPETTTLLSIVASVLNIKTLDI